MYAAVDAFNRKIEYIKVKNIYDKKKGKKVKFLPNDTQDFDCDKNYAGLLKKCGKKCFIKHKHKTYRPIRIRFLGGKVIVFYQVLSLLNI